MAEIAIEALVPSEGAVPFNSYDATSQTGYTLWEVNDEARFSIVVPDNYLSGSDIFLGIRESSSSTSMNHQWRITTLLLRPGVNVTDELTESETFEQECQSPVTADQLATRTLKVTGSTTAGKISDIEIASGDVLSFTIKRIEASSNEDPNTIKVLNLGLSVAREETSISDCAGRVGAIVDTVRDLFNESVGGFLSEDFIIRSINRCQQDLAQEDYWRHETWIPATSGVGSLDLLSSIPNYQDIHQVQFSGRRSPMTSLGSFQEYEELSAEHNEAGIPEFYVIQNDTLYVWPVPNASLDSGYAVYHSYLPQDLTCSSVNPNPPIPKAHDMLFVYFTLKQAFLRDRHAPGADIKFQEYSQLYKREKQNLLGEGDPPEISLRSYR
jgi:hypothetical protein